jgi:hypothetical protein
VVVLVFLAVHLVVYSFALQRFDTLPLAYYAFFNVAEWAIVPLVNRLTVMGNRVGRIDVVGGRIFVETLSLHS